MSNNISANHIFAYAFFQRVHAYLYPINEYNSMFIQIPHKT